MRNIPHLQDITRFGSHEAGGYSFRSISSSACTRASSAGFTKAFHLGRQNVSRRLTLRVARFPSANHRGSCKQQEAKANGDYELMKQIRKERHKPLKELESFNGGICRLRGKAIRLQNQTDEEYLKKYMCENHLYFSEYVIDDLPSPDYVASWRKVYEWEYPLQL